MSNLKCKSCGLVNPLSAAKCKRCGACLVTEEESTSETAIQDTDESKKQTEDEPLTVWGCIQSLIVLMIAGVITGYLGLYIRQWLPSGVYPIVLLILIFLPAAVVGVAAGLGVLWFINLFIPGFFSKESSSRSASAG